MWLTLSASKRPGPVVSLFMLMFTLLMQSVQLLTPTLQFFHSAFLFLHVGYHAVILLAIMLSSCWLSVLSYIEYSANSGAGSSVTWKVLNFAPSNVLSSLQA